MTGNITNYSQEIAFKEKIFKECELKDVTFRDKEKDKIMKKLIPNMASLGKEHLDVYSDGISKGIADKLVNHRSFLSRIFNRNNISTAKLEKIRTEIIKEEMP